MNFLDRWIHRKIDKYIKTWVEVQAGFLIEKEVDDYYKKNIIWKFESKCEDMSENNNEEYNKMIRGLRSYVMSSEFLDDLVGSINKKQLRKE